MLIPHREQKVVLEGAWSGVSPAISRVPQGSVLGPLLFLVNIDDVMRVNFPTDCKLTVYADDILCTCPWTRLKTTHWLYLLQSKETIGSRIQTLLPPCFPSGTLENVTLVRPHMKYASSVWDPHLQKDKTALEDIQKFAMRMCAKQWDSTHSCMKTPSILRHSQPLTFMQPYACTNHSCILYS